MNDEQQQIARRWFEQGILDRPDVWPFPTHNGAPLKPEPLDLSKFGEALI